ncbi:MAG: TIR domain-containing protein [Hyphomonadaceae bacterium]|nr:MAG: hypothetical protein FD160_2793 [Caulobacteraceae bacterium]MBT9447782.1 TIR domain-containing protein [Hyphomonadaceae bacterium]TPW05114.1 MAG: hypothetical protein FD124_2297 [Alphaproteobacteria bacterium]
MADVVISYKRERLALVQHLAEVLSSYGVDVWWDYQLLAGEEFRRKIESEIRAAKATIVLWCSLSIDAPWVIDEATVAYGLGKLVPTTIEDVMPPIGLRQGHLRSLVEWDCNPEHPSIRALLNDLETKLDRKLRPSGRTSSIRSTWQAFGRIAIAPLTTSAPTSELVERNTKSAIADSDPGEVSEENYKLVRKLAGALAIPETDISALFAQQVRVRDADGVFSVARLHGAVKSSVFSAIHASIEGQIEALRARLAASEALRRKIDPLPGVEIFTEDAEEYSQWNETNNGLNAGLGVFEFKAGEHAGNKYSGFLAAGEFYGPGVYEWRDSGNPSSPFPSVFEGFNLRPGECGFGTQSHADGSFYAGGFMGEDRHNHGTLWSAQGFRTEGRWQHGKLDGYAVQWKPDGTILTVGYWKNGSKVATLPFSPPIPAPKG